MVFNAPHIISPMEFGIDCIANCLTDNSRMYPYIFNGISAWLIYLINPGPMYNKINPSPARYSKCFSSPTPIYHKLNLTPAR